MCVGEELDVDDVEEGEDSDMGHEQQRVACDGENEPAVRDESDCQYFSESAENGPEFVNMDGLY